MNPRETGSLGVAAIMLNRKIIGIEIDPKNLEIAENRLEWFVKKIVLPSYFPDEDPAEVLENWKKNNGGDSNGKSTPQSDQAGVFHINLTERKSDQPKKPAASNMVALKSKSEKPLTTNDSKHTTRANGKSKKNDAKGKPKSISVHDR